MVSGKSKICGVMGCPIEHSLSPLMHNFYSERTGTDLIYAPFLVEPGRLKDAVSGAYALGFVGMNVTVPHKQEVMKYLAELDEAAKTIGAVNTLVRMEGGFKGYNTDAAGFKRVMKESGIPVKDRSCILIGAGGAAMAAAFVLAEEGAEKVYVLNRSIDKARRLSQAIHAHFNRSCFIPVELDAYRDIQETSMLAVQTTSLGMHPDTEHALLEDSAFYKRIQTAIDIVYNPSETKFMRYVRQAGGRAIGGLPMLLYQGAMAYELWNPNTALASGVIEDAGKRLRERLEAFV